MSDLLPTCPTCHALGEPGASCCTECGAALTLDADPRAGVPSQAVRPPAPAAITREAAPPAIGTAT